MKSDLTTVITSFIAIVLLTLHFTSDTLRARPGNPEAGGSALVAAPVLVLFLYATVFLMGRRSGYIILIFEALCALLMPVFHVMFPNGVFSGQLARGVPGDFIFVWTLYALSVSGLFLFVLCVRGLWQLKRRASR